MTFSHMPIIRVVVEDTIYLFMPRAPFALSRTDSSLWASFSREVLSESCWVVDFWESGTASLGARIERQQGLMCEIDVRMGGCIPLELVTDAGDALGDPVDGGLGVIRGHLLRDLCYFMSVMMFGSEVVDEAARLTVAHVLAAGVHVDGDLCLVGWFVGCWRVIVVVVGSKLW